MNFVSIKTQDRSAARATPPTVPTTNPEGPAEHAEAVLSSRSTSNRHLPETGEEVERPTPQVPGDVSNLAATYATPAIVDLCGNQAVDPPSLPTSGSSLLSKRSCVDTGGPGLVGLSLGDDVSAITRSLRESCNVSASGSKSRTQLVDSHARFVNSVAEVPFFLLTPLFYIHVPCSNSIFFFSLFYFNSCST